MEKDDNTLAVMKKAIGYYKIPISSETITESLQSHPEYSSLKSICDFFDEWKIDNYPMRLDKNELKKANAPFIAHLNDDGEKLAFVPTLNGNAKVTYFDAPGKGKTINQAEFFSKYSGVSLLIDPDDNAGEDNYAEKRQVDLLHRVLPYLAAMALLLFIGHAVGSNENILHGTLFHSVLFVTKLIGLGICLLLMLKNLNIDSSVVDKLCSFHKKTDCHTLLDKDVSRVFGWLHWSDLGFIYFLSGWLMMISVPNASDYNLLAILSFASLGYVVFSIYYQAVVAKIWCPVCLGIQAILLVEAVLSHDDLWPLTLSWATMMKYGSIFLTVSFGVTLYKVYFKNKQTLQGEKLTHLKLKKNPAMFTGLLCAGGQKDMTVSEEIFVIGKKDPSVAVTAFLSLNCHPCQMAFNQLKALFEREEVSISLIFSLHNEDKPFAGKVAGLFMEKQHQEAIELLDNWYNGKRSERASLMKQAIGNNADDIFETVQNRHRELFKKADISATPTVLVNGYKYPKEYQIKDIVYFIETLKSKQICKQ